MYVNENKLFKMMQKHLFSRETKVYNQMRFSFIDKNGEIFLNTFYSPLITDIKTKAIKCIKIILRRNFLFYVHGIGQYIFKK